MWQLSEAEIELSNVSHKEIKYLWVYSAANIHVVNWHQKLISQRRAAGYDVKGICNTLPEDNYRWYPYAELDQKWRRRHKGLMELYSQIALAMEDRDVLILYNGANLHPEFVQQLSGFKVYTFGDPESWNQLAGPIGPAFDLHFGNQFSEVEKFKKNGMVNAYFCPLGSQVFKDEVDHLNKEQLLDIRLRQNSIALFCGRTGWRNERLDTLYAAFPTAYIKGKGWPAGYATEQEIKETYLTTQIGWNIHNTTGFNFRTYDLASYGVMQLCDCTEDLHKIFIEGSEIIGYSSVAECIEKTNYYLSHPEEQREIAYNAWRRWQRDYTPSKVWDYLTRRIALHLPEAKRKQSSINSADHLMSQLQIDAAGITHWESSYAASKGIAKGWEPYGYTAKTLENILLKALAQSQPDSILEVGCGNSSWLPYLGKRTGASVSGLDYSASGCKLAEANLAAEQVEGTIYHGDLFSPPENLIGQFDFVYSLGVVEHFSDTDGVIMALKRFVRPGGWLLTEIPNLKGSFHGLLTHFWQPGIFFKHVPLNSDDLSTAYERCGLSQVEAGYAGLFSLNIVAWGKEPRWPQAEKTLLPLLYPTVRLSERVLAKVKNYKSPIHFLAPFIYATGRVEN